MQRRHAVLLLVGEPDPELEAERLGDLVVEEGAEALARDALHDLADQPAVGGGVVAVRGAGLPHRRLGLEGPDHRLPGQRLLEGERGVDVGQAGLVAQQPAHGDVRLAGRLELGPVLGDRRVDVEVAPLGEQVGARRGGALGGREHELEGVLRVGRAARRGRPPRPTGRRPSARRRRPRSPAPTSPCSLEVGAERVRHPLEPGLDCPTDLCHTDPPRRLVQAGTPDRGCTPPATSGGTGSAEPGGVGHLLGEEHDEELGDRHPRHRGAGGGAVVVAQQQTQRPPRASRARRRRPCTPTRAGRAARRWPAGPRAARTRAACPTAWNDETMATAIRAEQGQVGAPRGAGRGCRPWPR